MRPMLGVPIFGTLNDILASGRSPTGVQFRENGMTTIDIFELVGCSCEKPIFSAEAMDDILAIFHHH